LRKGCFKRLQKQFKDNKYILFGGVAPVTQLAVSVRLICEKSWVRTPPGASLSILLLLLLLEVIILLYVILLICYNSFFHNFITLSQPIQYNIDKFILYIKCHFNLFVLIINSRISQAKYSQRLFKIATAQRTSIYPHFN
jgi:hypothetical protein